MKQEPFYKNYLPTWGNMLFTLCMIGLLIVTQPIWADVKNVVSSEAGNATINYQGQMADANGNPQNGSFDMTFSLWDAVSGGNLIWGPETHAAVPVSNGLFNLGLGSQTPGGIPITIWGNDRYLEITVNGEMLTPRELIRSVSVASMALTVSDGAITTEKIADGSVTYAQQANNTTLTSTTSQTPVLLDSMSITTTIDSAGGVLVIFTARWGHSVENNRSNFVLYRDGILLTHVTDTSRRNGESIQNNIALSWLDQPPSGTHTYSIYYHSGDDSPGTTYVGTRQLQVVVLKK